MSVVSEPKASNHQWTQLCPHFLEEPHTECKGMNLFIVVRFNAISVSTFYSQLLIPDRDPVDVFRDSWHTEQDDFAICMCETERVIYCNTGTDAIKSNIYATN